MNNQPTQLLLQSRVFKVERVVRTLKNGREITRDVIRHPGSVVILPVVDNEHICLIRNYRVAVGDWLLELPAGTREPDEPAQITAIRELGEETGYTCDTMELLARYFPSPGILDEEMHVFLASGLRVGKPRREEGEEIENVILPWSEAFAKLKRGEIRDGKTLLGLLLWRERTGSS